MMATTPVSRTTQGTILGTFQYMAPEQIEGVAADTRTDIFSFGCVVYEMLAGKKAFEGKTQASLIGAILEREPAPLRSMQQSAPPALDHAVKRCLLKDPDKRWQTMTDLREELAWIESGATAPDAEAVPVRRRRGERLAWAGAVCGAAILAALIATRWTVAPADTSAFRFTISPPTQAPEAWNISLVSPDGRHVIFGGAFILGIGNQLWVRSLDSAEAHALPGTAGANAPFWSPDSRTIAFSIQGKLKKVDVAAGAAPAATICDAPNQVSGAWSGDGTILFTSADGGLARVPAAGGQPEPVTTPDRAHGETSHRSPSFLPDGRHFLYFVQALKAVFVGSIDSHDAVRLIEADSAAQYAAPGYLLFMRGGTLLAQPFDAGHRRLSGDPVAIADKVGARASFSVSQNGVLVYRTSTTAVTQLAWFDRAGRPLGTLAEPAGYREFVLTRDGAAVAVERIDPEGGKRGVWQIDVARGIGTRLTLSPDNDENMVWSPDGRQLVFTSDGSEGAGLFHKSLGGGAVTTLLKSAERKWPEDWSSDGRYIVSVSVTHRQLEILPMFGDRKPFVFLDTPSFKDEPQFSPDVRWMAYLSDESGRYEVYVERFPQGGDRVRVSSEGGGQPKWRRDGNELFYLGLDGTLMSVEMRDGQPAGLPSSVFRTRINVQPLIHQYAVTPDGSRFLMIVPPADATTVSPFTVVVNWPGLVKK